MFDAYTIKKVVPRLVIAIIAIQLSWFIFTEMIHIVNLVAYGVEGLIYAPFGGREQLSAEIILGSLAQGTNFTWTGLIVGGGAATWFLGPLGLLSLGLTIILALLIGVFLLSLRRLIIIALLLLAPIALVAWILPGTEKVWKIWWESFSKLLYVYPIILLLFAAGRAFGSVAAKTNTNNTLKVIVVMLAIYGPFFLIPKTFQLAGSAFGNLAGIVNNSSRGLFDRNKKYRGQKIAENMEKTKNYQRFGEDSMFGRTVGKRLNTFGGASTNIWRDARRGKAGIASGRAAGRTLQGATAFKNDAIVQANQNDDTFLLALASEQMAQQKIAAAQRKYDAAVADPTKGADSAEARAAMAEINARQNGLNNARGVASRGSTGTRLAAVNALSKTGYQFSSGEAGYNELASTMRGIVGDDDQAYASAMNEAQFHLKSAGRFDLGGINHGAGYDPGAGVGKASLYELANGKKESIGAMVEAAGTDEEKAIVYQELRGMLPNSKGGNRDEILKQMSQLETGGIGAVMSTATGTGRTKQVRENYVAGALGWSPDEQARGWRTTERPETLADVAQEKARTYERPDPNNIP